MKLRLGSIVVHLILIVGVALMAFPFLWTLTSSFKPMGEIFRYPPTLLPEQFILENYRRLFTDYPFVRSFWNSAFIGVSHTVLVLFFASMGGFAFAKYDFRFKKGLFLVLMGSMMVPFYVLLVPLFVLMMQLNGINTYWGVVIPQAANAFSIFFIRQNAHSIPNELMEAARIDGCSEFGIYRQIAVPLLKPALAALTIIVFMNAWNDFIWPLIIMRSPSMYTLPVLLASFVSLYRMEYGLIMAGSFLAVLPIIILFLVMQKHFMAGITLGAVKG